MLAERELILGTVECGVDGIVSRRIFDTPDGPAVLGNSLVVDEVEKAINLLDLPRPQFRKAGDFSAKAARAAAREGRAFLGADLCLAVWGSAPLDDSRPVHIALDTGEQVIDHTFQVEGQGGRATERLADRALDMVRQALS